MLFLILVLTHIGASYLYDFAQNILGSNVLLGLLYSQLIVIIPTLCFLFYNKIDFKEIGPFHKINISSILMVILFTYLIMPLITTVNIITLFFTDNTALELSNSIMDMPFILNFLMIAVLAPLSEEIIFRGIIFSGYKKKNIIVGAIYSGIIFGFMHMNFNQMSYAVIIGIILALLNEAAGSIWASITAHIVINAQNVIAMYVSQGFIKNLANYSKVLKEYGISIDNAGGISTNLTPEYLTGVLVFYGIVSVFTTALAIGVYIWLAKHNNRLLHIKQMYKQGLKGSGERITVPFVVAVLICLVLMVAYEISK